MDCEGVWGGTHIPTFNCEDESLVCSVAGCNDLSSVDYNLPDKFGIDKIFPNPFNPKTTIDYQISEPSDIKLEIYNIRGQKVDVLKSEFILSGHYSANWNGSIHPSGIYFIVLYSKQSIIRKKMILLK
jgi:hypothetical protein